MERALTLIATGTLTVAMARASRGKAVNLPRTLNLSTGKDSMRQTGFSDAAWGKATCSYAKSASSLTTAKFNAIIQDAQPFVNPKSTRAHSKTEAKGLNISDDEDERGCLVENSDDSNNEY